MDRGGSLQGNEERGAERLMDEYLKSIGLHRKKIAKDGSCLFRAVAEQVLHCQSLHTEVRAKCVEFLKQSRESYEAFIEGDFEDYLLKLQDPQQWVGEVEISALAVMYKRDFLIFQEPGKPAVNITDNNFKDKVRLCFLNGNHYDSVYPVGHIKNTALCQSILYELLYDGVFKVDRSLLGMCQRNSRPADVLIDDNMFACASSDESDLDAGDALWVENGTSSAAPRHSQSYRGRGRGKQLPERVRRSLNPTLLRNIEYDVWHKTKRAQQKMDYCIAAGMQYAAGDRCQVRLEGSGRIHNATVKEVPPNNSLVTVFIEELGKRQVPLWSLRPPSDEGSWSTVSRDKRLSNGHGDREERGRGRGRGKPVPASSSVAQATAPGSSGRMLKQHSWPPQATVEEQAGTRANRKSVSSVESPLFGLTEEQRLAKEEEERNVALVEIQLRDEHSFPALGLGIQGEAGRKKGAEKKRSLRTKTMSPVEDVRAPSPSAGERPKSSTPPLATTTVAAAPTTTTTAHTNPDLPAAKPPPAAAPSANSDPDPAWLSSLKAPMPNMNIAAAATATAASPVSSSAPSLPLTCAAPTDKTNTHSYALAVGAPPTSPPSAAATPSTKPPSVPSSATLFSLHTPALPAASSPPIPPAVSSSSSPPTSSSSAPPSSSIPPPTFIAPIAPSPVAAQGFLPRSSPSPPSFPSSAQSASSSSFIHHAPQVHEAPTAAAQTPNSLPNIGSPLTVAQTFQTQSSLAQIQSQISVSQTQTQPSLAQIQTQSQVSLPQNHMLMSQMQTEAQSSLPRLQHQPQSHTEVASVPQNQIQRQADLQSQAQYPPQSQSHPAPGASYPHSSQTSVPVSASMQPQPSITQPHLHSQPAQPPHPSQVPHPSLSASPTHPSLQTQTPNTQNQTEAPAPPAQPESQPHPPSHHPPLQSAHPLPPLHPQSIPGAVPLQQLSQLYQDPLYPGFPQGEKGDMAVNPPYSISKSGDDLPQDVNVLRFFFNLGVKAYTMPMYQPYMYLFPLQHAYTLHPKLPSRSPSPTPHYPPPNAPTRHQEVYPHPQYPSTSASVAPQYDHHVAPQAPPPEPPHPSESAQNPAGYPVTQPAPHRMSWQQHHLPPTRNPRNQSYPVRYTAPSPPYPTPPPSTQGYHQGQGSGHPLYPQSMPQYPPSSLGYPSSATPEELQVSHGPVEQLHTGNGGPMPGHGPGRVPGPLEGSAAANVANANKSRTMVAPGVSGFGLKKEQGEGLTPVLLVDPPLNNTPIVAWVSEPEVKDVSVSVATMQTPSSTPGSPGRYDLISKRSVAHADNNPPRMYRGQHKHTNHSKAYSPLEAGFPATVAMEPLSVGCNTDNAWEESEGFKPPNSNHRGSRRSYRGTGGGRGRGGGHRRRQVGEAGAGLQFSSSHRGRERGY